MATKQSNVSVGETISSTVKYGNENDAARNYNINASVYISNNAVQHITDGYVCPKDLQNSQMSMLESSIATFSTYSPTSLTVSFTDMENVMSVMEDIIAFIADVKEDVSSNKDE